MEIKDIKPGTICEVIDSGRIWKGATLSSQDTPLARMQKGSFVRLDEYVDGNAKSELVRVSSGDAQGFFYGQWKGVPCLRPAGVEIEVQSGVTRVAGIELVQTPVGPVLRKRGEGAPAEAPPPAPPPAPTGASQQQIAEAQAAMQAAAASIGGHMFTGADGEGEIIQPPGRLKVKVRIKKLPQGEEIEVLAGDYWTKMRKEWRDKSKDGFQYQSWIPGGHAACVVVTYGQMLAVDDFAAFHKQCIAKGHVDRGTAYVNSYEGMRQVAGRTDLKAFPSGTKYWASDRKPSLLTNPDEIAAMLKQGLMFEARTCTAKPSFKGTHSMCIFGQTYIKGERVFMIFDSGGSHDGAGKGRPATHVNPKDWIALSHDGKPRAPDVGHKWIGDLGFTVPA